MENFVREGSIVRNIWGKSDTILFIFAGSSAEFALNKAVDWLYFTGKLPANPIERFLSTVSYARLIVFSSKEQATNAINKLRSIHSAVEHSRQSVIPDWAYRDVLFMLIYYSIASFELLERKLTHAEKEEVFSVFYEVGYKMGLTDLSVNYDDWLIAREEHLKQDIHLSTYSKDLFKQYKKHLGLFRFMLLKNVQAQIVPGKVRTLLKLKKTGLFLLAILTYRFLRKIQGLLFIKFLLLPAKYRSQIKALELKTVNI
jgi:uncharacterized protein (DUF2236 family)